MLNMPHYRATDATPAADRYDVTYRAGEPDEYTVAYDRRTTEGSNREEYLVTGVAVIDRDRYVVRVQVNGTGRSRFIPVVGRDWTAQDGTARWSGTWHDRATTGTKRAAFEWLAEQEPTGPVAPEDLADLNPDADDRDFATLAQFVANLDAVTGPRVGDFVVFTDGRVGRFAHDHDERGLQTTDGGSFHLGAYGASFSGGLDRVRARTLLHETGDTRPGSVWIWHHGRVAGSNGVTMRVPVRVFTCAEPFHRAR
jgi:hypothetical protein